MHVLWKQGQASQKEYRALFCRCRKKTKGHSSIIVKLIIAASYNKKSFQSALIARADLKETLDWSFLKMVIWLIGMKRKLMATWYFLKSPDISLLRSIKILMVKTSVSLGCFYVSVRDLLSHFNPYRSIFDKMHLHRSLQTCVAGISFYWAKMRRKK